MASLERQEQPTVVAEVIRDIVDGKSTQFGNPAGSDALPLSTSGFLLQMKNG